MKAMEKSRLKSAKGVVVCKMISVVVKGYFTRVLFSPGNTKLREDWLLVCGGFFFVFVVVVCLVFCLFFCILGQVIFLKEVYFYNYVLPLFFFLDLPYPLH